MRIERDPRARLRLLQKRLGSWRMAQPLYGLGPIIAAAGVGYLAADAPDQGTRTIFAAACLELAIGALAELSRSSSAVGWTSSRLGTSHGLFGDEGSGAGRRIGGKQAMAPAPGCGGGHGGWLAGCCLWAAGGRPVGWVAGVRELRIQQVGDQSEEPAGL